MKKLTLQDLKVSSFVTDTEGFNANTIKGGDSIWGIFCVNTCLGGADSCKNIDLPDDPDPSLPPHTY